MRETNGEVTQTLNKQIQIISCDTGNFYSKHEERLHKANHKVKAERRYLRNRLDKTTDPDERERIEQLIALKTKYVKSTKQKLLDLLARKVEANIASNGRSYVRVLHDNSVGNMRTISVFDSALTRTIGIGQDEFSDAFLVVQVYYFDIMKDLIYNGFQYNGEHYIYFTSSAGQIRVKKMVFIKESVYREHERTLMCGLTLDDINAKGGNNPNKHLAYLALVNSATDVWHAFNIDKSIVIDDFETDVLGTFDFVNTDDNFSITRMTDYIPVPHTDGAGMMLPKMGRNRIVRLPWIKGLLGVFDFVKFIDEYNCSPKIKDIYGDEHDIIAEGIEVIFTKSQFKLWKYYDNWEQYKKYYKEYGCTAGYTKIEESRIQSAKINYQMLQTLTDISDEEIAEIAQESIDRLNSLCSSVDNMKSAFGATPYNSNPTPFQKCIELYPNILNDEYSKARLRDIKNGLIKKYKSGKLEIFGKYTFLLPDFYAACQYWFMDIKNPKGLLADGEVYCSLFPESEKLDCLRSPHLYKEHAVRKNMAYTEDENLQKWFCTNAIYTSTHDLITKILMFDVDGDCSLVVANPKFVEIAERNMKDIVPLYYNMRKASPSIIDSYSIYNGLKAAFVGGNIGIISNNISKIWNSDVFVSGTDEEKKKAIDCIKRLCAINNETIDYAKTLYKSKVPKNVHEEISSFTNNALPYFFVYAKDKKEYQVIEANQSFVNKIASLIKNPRLDFRKAGLEKLDYRLLMKHPNINVQCSFNGKSRPDRENTDPMIIKYLDLQKEFYYNLDNIMMVSDMYNVEKLMQSSIREALEYSSLVDKIRDELSVYGYTPDQIADRLVKYLYCETSSKYKTALWLCYGDILYNNLCENLGIKNDTAICESCGKEFYLSPRAKNKTMCKECYTIYRRKYFSEMKRKSREKSKMSTDNIFAHKLQPINTV